MKLDNAVVLVTGANRGIGRVFAQAALARGARKVYAAARDPSKVDIPGVEAIALDVTDDASVAAAAARCGDVTLVVNNAGIAQLGGALHADAMAVARAQMEVNFFGVLRMAHAFAPILKANGGGGIVNVLSIASWINGPTLGLYGATKSAAWNLTNSLRQELRGQGTQVLALHMGWVDTDMTRGFEVPKSRPEDIVARTLDALEAGAPEVLADEQTKNVKKGLSAEPAVYIGA